MSTPTPHSDLELGTRNRSWSIKLLLAGMVVMSAGMVAGFAFASVWRKPKEVLADDPRYKVRIRVMQEHLATQAAPFIILAGDSHAELLNWDRICGFPIVNLGLGGAAAVHYGKILDRLRPERRAEAAIIFLGTNDLARRLKPETVASLTRFEQRFGGVTADLKRFADRVVYAPVFPPGNDPRVSNWVATEIAERYRTVAEKACVGSGCAPLKVDAALFSFAEDAVHLDRRDRAEGGGLHRRLESEICPAGRMSGTGLLAPSHQKKDLLP